MITHKSLQLPTTARLNSLSENPPQVWAGSESLKGNYRNAPWLNTETFWTVTNHLGSDNPTSILTWPFVHSPHWPPQNISHGCVCTYRERREPRTHKHTLSFLCVNNVSGGVNVRRWRTLPRQAGSPRNTTKKKAPLQKPFFIYAHLIKYTYRNYIKVSMNKHNFCFIDFPPEADNFKVIFVLDLHFLKPNSNWHSWLRRYWFLYI